MAMDSGISRTKHEQVWYMKEAQFGMEGKLAGN
jgi:hypothetical protein